MIAATPFYLMMMIIFVLLRRRLYYDDDADDADRRYARRRCVVWCWARQQLCRWLRLMFWSTRCCAFTPLMMMLADAEMRDVLCRFDADAYAQDAVALPLFFRYFMLLSRLTPITIFAPLFDAMLIIAFACYDVFCHISIFALLMLLFFWRYFVVTRSDAFFFEIWVRCWCRAMFDALMFFAVLSLRDDADTTMIALTMFDAALTMIARDPYFADYLHSHLFMPTIRRLFWCLLFDAARLLRAMSYYDFFFFFDVMMIARYELLYVISPDVWCHDVAFYDAPYDFLLRWLFVCHAYWSLIIFRRSSRWCSSMMIIFRCLPDYSLMPISFIIVWCRCARRYYYDYDVDVDVRWF